MQFARTFSRSLLVAVVVLSAFSSRQTQAGSRLPAPAGTIKLDFSGVGTGTIGMNDFTDAAFTVEFTPVTSSLISVSPGVFRYPIVQGTISIAGVPTATFVESLYVFNNQSISIVGFGNDSTGDLVDLQAPGTGLNTFNLKTSFGPITGGRTSNYATNTPLDTTEGTLTFTSDSATTFTAMAASSVPLPGSGQLLAAGLGALLVARFYRRIGFGWAPRIL